MIKIKRYGKTVIVKFEIYEKEDIAKLRAKMYSWKKKDDNKDMKDCNNSSNGNIKFIPTQTLMKTKKDKINLAKFIIDQAKIFMSN